MKVVTCPADQEVAEQEYGLPRIQKVLVRSLAPRAPAFSPVPWRALGLFGEAKKLHLELRLWLTHGGTSLSSFLLRGWDRVWGSVRMSPSNVG